MSVILQLSPHDPLVARDGRPFGEGQGNRMRGMSWPLPSVLAGSFRTALVKSSTGLDFLGTMPQRLMKIAVAGPFPILMNNGNPSEMYLPAPSDAVVEHREDGSGIKRVHRSVPQKIDGGCDLPANGLLPVMLSMSQASSDFKPAQVPAWWPVQRYAEWLLGKDISFDSSFLNNPHEEKRDHVCLDAERGAAADGQIFSTAALNLSYLPRFGVAQDDEKIPFTARFAEVSLAARVDIPDSELELKLEHDFEIWHPLGGERRLVHWHHLGDKTLWECPLPVRQALDNAKQVCMILATPAIFRNGWKPGWLNDQLEGTPPGGDVQLKLVGVCNGRWNAVSGWSLAPPRGPKPIRRMVPAGSVYFFECAQGAGTNLSKHWLKSVSDEGQEQRDGFGLAIWGTWNNKENQ